MISFWEKESLTEADIIIVGGGLVGLSTACSILEQDRNKKVIVLERGLFPAGASTRNAGFACFSDVSETFQDIALSNEDKAIALLVNRYNGLERLRKRLGDAAIGLRITGGYEPIIKDEGQEITQDNLDYLNKQLFPFFKKNIFSFVNDRIQTFGFRNVTQLILNDKEGMLHTGMLIDSLWAYASQLGVRIINGADVVEFDETGNSVDVFVHHHVLKTNVPFRCKRLVLAANALISQFVPELGINPGRGQVIVTKPLPGLRFDGIFHFDEGYFYFRNIGDRILFGGGRNLDMQTETTTEFESNPVIMESLTTYLEDVIIPDTDYEIDVHWQGIMGFTSDKLPVVKKLTDDILVAFSCNGMGVALSSDTGEKAAALLLQ